MQNKTDAPKNPLPPIPAKRYFTIGEVSELCGVKPHVLRYWEQEFTQLRPMKRRGNRRYYQHHEVLLVRRIREAHPYLAEGVAARLARSYGTRAFTILDGARSAADLGRQFGAGLSEREVDYLMREEWAMTAEDVLWRRSKLGLGLTREEAAVLEDFMAARLRQAA